MAATEAFQSLLQLAVAVNVGYAAISTFQSSNLSRERMRIDALISSAKLYHDLASADTESQGDARDALQGAVNLRNDAHGAIARLENFAINSCRWAAVVTALISFALLLYATYWSGVEAAVWFQAAASVVCIPFLGMMGYALYASLKEAAPLAERRRSLDDRICEGLLKVS